MITLSQQGGLPVLGGNPDGGPVMACVNVTLNDGQVIKFEMDLAAENADTSYSVDGAGVLTIVSTRTGECRRHKGASKLTVAQQRFSPSAWRSVEEVYTLTSSAQPVWAAGVIGGPVPGGQAAAPATGA